MAFEADSTTPPTIVNSSVGRTREYLTAAEIETLIAAARKSSYGHRDATMILIAYRHGLRASEVCDLQHQVELTAGRLSCGFDSGMASDGTLKMRMLCTDPEDKQSSMYGAQLKLLPGKKIELIIEPMDQQ
ncbi:MAG: tyrosine-type recombinase/integrase [Xanthobacteraceae bacterium]